MSGISEQDVAAAKARLEALRQERDKAEQVVRVGRVRTLEDFENLTSHERTQFYGEQPDAYGAFMEEKARVWRARLTQGGTHRPSYHETREK